METIGKNSIDQLARLLGRSKSFSGREDEWHDWSLKFGATAATLSDDASTWINRARERQGSLRDNCILYLFICVRDERWRSSEKHQLTTVWKRVLLREWYQPKTRGLALLNESLGWDFGSKQQFLQRMKDWENATLEYNRTSSAPLHEEVLVVVLISRSPKEVRTYLHVQVREDTAKLGHVRQLFYDCLRTGKAWNAPRTEETAEKTSPNFFDYEGRCPAP